MNVGASPLHVRPVRAPSWGRLRLRVFPVPGTYVPAIRYGHAIPAPHHLVRPGPKYVNLYYAPFSSFFMLTIFYYYKMLVT